MDFKNVIWNKNNYEKYLLYLLSLGEKKYQKFSNNLTKTKFIIIGIRLPILRNIAKEISKSNIIDFLDNKNFKYFEEVLIYGFVLAKINNEEDFDNYFYTYLEYIDNWSVCDSFCNSLILFDKNKEKYFKVAIKLLKSDKEFKVRVGLISILSHFIIENNLDDIFSNIDEIKLDDYYVKMGIAWLLCECYIKYPDITIKYISNNKLSKWVVNKTIQKIKESYRVSDDDKKLIEKLKKY